MSKEKNSGREPKKSGKKAGRRFDGRRDRYVDTFRWGFVDGEGREDIGEDDELFYGKQDIELDGEPEVKPAKTAEKKFDDRRKRSDEKTEAASKEKSGNQARKTSKKQAKKIAAAQPLFDDLGDDDDLNLPSYGRTPIPKDDELPQPVKKSSSVKAPAPVREERRDKRQKPEKRPVEPKTEPKVEPKAEPKIAPPPERTEVSGKPKREQMVWDPDKREYVPLIVPERKEQTPQKQAGRERPKKIAATPTGSAQTGSAPTGSAPTGSASTGSAPTLPDKPEKPEAKTAPPRREKKQARPGKSTAEFEEISPMPPKTERRDDVRKQGREQREKERKVETSKRPERPERSARKAAETSAKREDRQPVPSKPPENREHLKNSRPERRPPQRADVPRMVDTTIPDPADIESETKGFAELGVSDVMLEALKIVRYLEPTPIQSGVFKQVQAGRDVMGQAQTGTGKTAAFSIPIIEGIEDCPPGNDPVALILVPTRELAVQVRDEAARLCYGRDVRIAACYGGKPIAKQISKLKDGVDVIVGTPGRILDLMNRRALSLDALRWVVLDEADRMLDIGFRPDIEKILRRTPKARQTLLFSATLPAPVVKLAEKYMQTPEILDFSNKGVAVDTIEQFYVTVDPERKFDALVHLLNEQQPNQAIIFTRTKRGADRLARLLSKRVDNLAAIHGDLSQGERDRVMGQFRTGKLRYLVATDVVGRGIDVSGISHIINYDIPAFCDDYVHRVGRTGRMGREGVAFTFVTVQEGSELTRIEMRIEKLLKRADLKGFESFAKPVDTSDDSEDATPSDAKPVFGKPVRKIRRAL